MAESVLALVLTLEIVVCTVGRFFLRGFNAAASFVKSSDGVEAFQRQFLFMIVESTHIIGWFLSHALHVGG
jgi:hypothetical protein